MPQVPPDLDLNRQEGTWQFPKTSTGLETNPGRQYLDPQPLSVGLKNFYTVSQKSKLQGLLLIFNLEMSYVLAMFSTCDLLRPHSRALQATPASFAL